MKNIALKIWGFIKTNYIKLLLALGILISIIFFIKSCHSVKYVDMPIITFSSQRSDSIINKLNEKITVQNVIATNNQKAMRDLTDSIFNLKNRDARKIKDVIAFYQESSKFNKDTFFVPYDSIPPSDTLNYTNIIRVPVTKNIDSVYFSINETIQKEGIRINRLTITDSEYVRWAEIRNGLFKRNTIQVQILHKNPYISYKSNSASYQPATKPRILEKAIFIALGFFLGKHI